MGKMIPALLGIGALILSIYLVVKDKDAKFSSKYLNKAEQLGIGEEPSKRMFSTMKGFLLLFCLVIIFATLVYYFG